MTKERERGRYYISIEFTNGSNPYVRYGMKKREFNLELKKWEKNYNMELQLVSNLGGYFYKATERNTNLKTF